MPSKINCPEGHVLTVPEQRAGTYVRCPICRKAVRIPFPDELTKLARQSKKKKKAARPSPRQSGDEPQPRIEQQRAAEDDAEPPDASSRPAERTKAATDRAAAVQADPVEVQRPLTRAAVRPSAAAVPDGRTGPAPATPGPETTAEGPVRAEPAACEAPGATAAGTDKRPAGTPAANEAVANAETAPAASAACQSGGTAEQPATSEQPAAADEPASPEATPSRPRPAVRGVSYDAAKRWTAYYLGILLALSGLLNLGPAVMEIADYAQHLDSNVQHPVARWAYAALLIGAVQLVYAAYLVQLPDWSSVWVAAVVTLLIASGYAMLSGVVWLGEGDSTILQLLEMDASVRDRATLWCFSMSSVAALLAYFCGREGLRWYRAFLLQAEVHGKSSPKPA